MIKRHRTIKERIDLLKKYVADRPSLNQEVEWGKTQGIQPTYLSGIVANYSAREKISTRSILDCLKMGFLSPEDVAKYWIEPDDVRGGGKLTQRMAILEKRLTYLEKELGLCGRKESETTDTGA